MQKLLNDAQAAFGAFNAGGRPDGNGSGDVEALDLAVLGGPNGVTTQVPSLGLPAGAKDMSSQSVTHRLCPYLTLLVILRWIRIRAVTLT